MEISIADAFSARDSLNMDQPAPPSREAIRSERDRLNQKSPRTEIGSDVLEVIFAFIFDSDFSDCPSERARSEVVAL